MTPSDRSSVRPGAGLDLRSILEHEDAERLIDALARIVLAAARVRAARREVTDAGDPLPRRAAPRDTAGL
jgi:hypothetical protein